MTAAASPIFDACARLAAGGGRGALASVARRRGSLPMSATAKLLVTEDGARIGTVGGGCLEAEITERALAVLATGVPAVSKHVLAADAAGDYGLTCGGSALMLVEPVVPEETLAAVWAACADGIARGERATLVTGLDWSRGPDKCLTSARGVVGRESARTRAAVRAYADDDELPRWSDGVLVERVTPPPRLVVFGGGHVGARVAEAAAFAGWRVTIADDRAAFADPGRHPRAERTVTCDFAALPGELALDADSYVVVATRGHQHDLLIVDQLARRPLRYLGMLGSRRKVALAQRVLCAWGVAPEAVASLRAPIGLAIGADTPEEIAIAVVAEMIAVRRAGSRRRGGVALPPDESIEFLPDPFTSSDP